MQGWGYQQEFWGFRGDGLVWEIAGSCEIARGGVLGDAHPVIERLQWKLDVGRSFEFENCQAAGVRDSEEVGNAAITGCEGRDLTVDGRWAKLGIDLGEA